MKRADADGGSGVSEVHERARRWLDSRILADSSCAERLADISNNAVNAEAQAATVARMRDEVEVWTYLRALLDPTTTDSAVPK